MGSECSVGPLEAGAALGDHLTIIRPVSDGGLGEVYLAWSSRYWTTFACKTVRPDLADDPELRRALLREGRVLRAVAHPRIVQLFEIGDGPVPYLLLEYLDGPTIVDLCRRFGPLRPEDAARLAMHVASALLHVHRRGYLHLDVKPGNVLLVHGYPTLIDFSLARRRSQGRPAEAHGTPPYMAPEQCLRRPLSPATDVFGVGCLLYKLLSGRSPFPDGVEDEAAPLELRYPQLLERAPDLATIRPEAPSELAALVATCLDRDPGARYADMLSLLYALAPFAGRGIWPDGLDPAGGPRPLLPNSSP